MKFDNELERGFMTGVFGGILPVYGEKKDYAAACSCEIGRYMEDRYRMRPYDSLPGTSTEDTKHDLVMAHFQRLLDEQNGTISENRDTDFPF